MKYRKFFLFSFLLFYNVITLDLKTTSKNFPFIFIEIGNLTNAIPSVLTTDTDKLIMVGNPHTYSYMPNKSNTSNKISDEKLSEEYTFVLKTIKFENELYEDNVCLTNNKEKILFNFEYVYDNSLSRLLSFPYIGFFGLGKSNSEDKYNLNLINQLKNNNIIENKIIYFNKGKWTDRKIIIGYKEKIKSIVECSYKNSDKRNCLISNLEIDNNIHEINTQAEFIYNNLLYHVFPEKFKSFFDEVLLNYKCIWIRFNHYPMYACDNLNNMPEIYLTINKKKLNFKRVFFGETVKVNPFLKILFKKDIDYIQLSIPILNEKNYDVIFDDDNEKLYLNNDE